MSDGYYIYLDRRDVGKGDLYFVKWGKLYNKPGESIPIFGYDERRMIFKDKDMADKTAEKIARMNQGLERILHVEPCEEATFDE